MIKTTQVISTLESIVGTANVIFHPEDLLVYEYDGSIDRGMPQAVVLPSSTEQISNIIMMAASHNIPIIGRGSGTGLSGGSVAALGGIQIVLSKMNHILNIDTNNRTATVEPGVLNWDLDIFARQHNLRYAPDPSSQKACTMGGNIAENAGGPHCLLYGVTSNHILGLEVVLENGEILQLGSPVNDTPGYDLRGVFIGSEGTFGIASKIIVRLLPIPENTKTFLGIFASLDDASDAVSAIIGEGIVPAALEMIDGLAIRALDQVMKTGYPKDAGAVLLIELEGMIEDVDTMGVSVENILLNTGAKSVRTAEDEKERSLLWAGRKGAIGAIGVLAPNYYLVDGVVPRTKIKSIMRTISAYSEEYDLPIANIFHAGDGNIHPCVLFDERQPGMTEKAVHVGEKILEACVSIGGTLTGEHGVGLEKKGQMPLLFSPEDMDTMKRVRDSFAPKNLFNPGKIFPGGPEFDRALQKGAFANAGTGSYV
jgi:glycolate oxidase